MEYKIIWSAFSEKQIDAIFEYYKENASLKVAEKIVREIILAPEGIKSNPKIGARETLLENRKTEYRYIVTTNYKIIYSVDEKSCSIKIADVFDTRQNPVKMGRGK